MTGCCPLCGHALASDDLILVPERHLVCRGGDSVYLSPKEWELFSKLHQSIGRVVSRGVLLDWIYQLEQNEPFEKIIDVFVMKVRRKIKPLNLAIITHHRCGFSLAYKGKSRVVKAEAA